MYSFLALLDGGRLLLGAGLKTFGVVIDHLYYRGDGIFLALEFTGDSVGSTLGYTSGMLFNTLEVF